MSIIRYRFKADKNFESVKIDGMNCSLGELKRLIAAKSSRSGTYHPKDDYDLFISNANTHEEYKDNSDLIPRNASVIVARRIRGTFDTLTPSTNQKPVASSDDIIKGILLPAILNQNSTVPTTNSSSSSVVETNAIPLEQLTESTSTAPAKEMTEDEMIKEIQAGSQARYVTQQPPYRTNLFVCHNCKQPGHIKNQCPLILQSSSTGTTSTSSSGGDGTQTTTSGSIRPSIPHPSHIVTRHAPYQMSYHHRGNRSHRGAGHPRGEPILKKTTGIPRDRLIPIPKPIPGALRDQTGASVVPRQMAELYVERIEKKADALAQIARQSDEKNISSPSSSIPTSSKSTDEDLPPNDLLCPLCKHVYTDAVITPCCNLSFCDACIRTALIDSSEHECPHCRSQHVAIDQINPNLYLRSHVKRWHERRNQSSYSYLSIPQQRSEQDVDTTSTNLQNSNEIDEYDPTNVSIDSQQTVPSIKAPIVIKMQPRGKSQSQSPQPIVSTRPADMTFEDEKGSDSEQITSSQKDVNTIEEITDTLPSSTTFEIEKPENETPPVQTTPVNPIYSSPSPSTTLAPTTAVVPHYYPAPTHHNVIYPHHIPQTTTNGLYQMQPTYYPPPMGIRYPPGGIHHYPAYPPAPPIHHHPPPPPHPIIPAPHIPPNTYNIPGFHPPPAAPFTSTSTFIAHHQTATQPISTALSENEFYIKQRYFQRIQRSPSPRRRSRSSSSSSYSSSDSRSSSRSRYNRRRRSSRSRSRSRRRVKSPSRDDRRQRRSSSYRNRRPPIETKEKYSSKYRRSPPRPSRDHERRRSPRPPPTIQQSTQRTIVYMQESSHSSRDRRRRSKSRSGGNDDHIKKEQQSQSESTPSSSSVVVAPPTLSSKIETVVEGTNDKVQEENSKNGKKHKKHHKKHRHSSSKSKKHHRSKDKEKQPIIDTPKSVIEIQS